MSALDPPYRTPSLGVVALRQSQLHRVSVQKSSNLHEGVRNANPQCQTGIASLA